jgi:hypothetical protein
MEQAEPIAGADLIQMVAKSVRSLTPSPPSVSLPFCRDGLSGLTEVVRASQAGPERSEGSLTFLFTRPALFVDPGRPSAHSPWRTLCVDFWPVNTTAVCFLIRYHEAVSSFGKCGLSPCGGLRDSLCTLHLFRSVGCCSFPFAASTEVYANESASAGYSEFRPSG